MNTMNEQQERIIKSLAESIIAGGDALTIDRGLAIRSGLDMVAKNNYLGIFISTSIVSFPLQQPLERTSTHMRDALHALSQIMAQRAEDIKLFAEGAANSEFKFLTESNDPTTTETISNSNGN